MKLRVWLLVALVAVGGCAKNSEKPAQGEGQPKQPAAVGTDVGSSMPAYRATALDGTPFDLAKERGNVVFLNLWATWCGPCRYEIPELQKLHDSYSSKGFKVVGVSVDEGKIDEVRQFVIDQKMTYPVAHDPEGKLATLLETTVLPTSVIVDRKGKVVWKHFGIVSMTDQEMTKALETALGG